MTTGRAARDRRATRPELSAELDAPDDLFALSPSGYLATTPDGIIVQANEVFLELCGRSRAEIVGGVRFVELLSVGGRIYHDTHYVPMLHLQGRVRELALDLVRPEGSRTPVLVNAVLEHDSSGVPRLIRMAVFGAAQRREYERELLRAKERAEASEARATRLARTLQQTFIPPAMPPVPGLDLAGVYRPAGAGDEVGGDFYDVFEVATDEWVVLIGDVCGKGADAAVVTALARFALRGAAVRVQEPSGMLRILNDVLLGSDVDRFCTVAVLRLRRRDGTWSATVACAGHPLPLLLAPGHPPRAVGTPGSLAGAFDDATFTDTEVPLASGEVVALFTDGVTEARRGAAFYGDERLARIAASAGSSAGAVARAVLEDVLAFQSDLPSDDIAVVAIGIC